MKDEEFGVVTFESTSHAIKGEKILKSTHFKIKTIPTPREITSSCGLSIKFDLMYINEIRKIVENNELCIKGIYKLSKRNFKNYIKKIN